MKIAIVAPSSVPFCVGGAEKLWWGLLTYINEETNHHADLIKLPSRELSFWDLVETYREFSRLDLSHFDLVISTKYPSWMVKHPRHVCYMQHRLRGLYDTYHLTGLPVECESDHRDVAPVLHFLDEHAGDARYIDDAFDRLERLRASGAPPEIFAFPGPLIRKVVRFLDDAALSPERIARYAAISHNVAGREGYFPAAAPVQVLHHPSNLHDFSNGESRYFFTIGRLDGPKRVRLLIEAMRRANTPLQLKIAGTGPDEEVLKELAAGDPRIEFLGFVRDSETIKLYSDALAVLYPPYDEDYGLVTIEAMMSGKPVITTRDAGGPNEFVTDGETGFSVEPRPDDIAAKLDFFSENPSAACAMAANCRNRVEHITWGSVVSGLLAEPEHRVRRVTRRKRKLTVAVTFPLTPARGGGQVRILNLYGNLGPDFTVDVVSLVDHGHPAYQHEISPSMREIRVPRSLAHAKAEWRLAAKLGGVPTSDVAAPRLFAKSPQYVDALARSAATSDILVAAHPYLAPALEVVRKGQPVVYEAHNVESILKASILPDCRWGRYLLALTTAVEQRICDLSSLIAACSEDDLACLGVRYGAPRDHFALVPNGVDVGSVPFTAFAERKNRKPTDSPGAFTALFMGSWHGPNNEAALHVLDMAGLLPRVRFLIVGSVCSYLGQHGRKPPANLRLLGTLDEEAKSALLSWVDLAVNPMSNGSGSNLKMLDYMAAGVPVLTTPFGARGFAIGHNEHAIIAPLPEFPSEIDRLARADEDAIAAMVSNARALVENRYSWEVIGACFRTALDRLE